MGKKETEYELIRELLRAKEIRATPARIAIVAFVTKSAHPVTHLEVADKLTQSGFDKSTILRALNDLTEAELFRRMELGDHVWRYERIPEDAVEHVAHPHLLCVDCGSVQCLNDSQVELKTSKSLGRIEDILLKGHCKDCQ